MAKPNKKSVLKRNSIAVKRIRAKLANAPVIELGKCECWCHKTNQHCENPWSIILFNGIRVCSSCLSEHYKKCSIDACNNMIPTANAVGICHVCFKNDKHMRVNKKR